MSARDVSVRAGGWALISAAVLFMAVFGYLAQAFNYPDVLDGRAADVLPRLLALGSTGRAVWALYGVLPLLLIPASLGAYAALSAHAPALMRLAVVFAIMAAGAMMVGLVRWPSIHWILATRYVDAGAVEQQAIATVFEGLNSFLGNYIGEFTGELSLNLTFLFTALALRTNADFPRWLGTAGVAVAAAGLIGMWRNVTPFVAGVAEVDNYLLPLWMTVLGAALVRAGHTPPIASTADHRRRGLAPSK